MPAALISQDTVFTDDKPYFFDANVWCYIHSPQHVGDPLQELYAKVWAEIKKAGGRVVVSPLLISEYINSRLRVYWREWKEDNSSLLSFKSYRTQHIQSYKKALRIVMHEVADILRDSAIINDISSKDGSIVVMDRIIRDNIDVNDSYFIELSARDDLILVTHDADYKIAASCVLTYNNNITGDSSISN